MSKTLEMELLNSEEARSIKGGDTKVDTKWCLTAELKMCAAYEVKLCLTFLAEHCEKNGQITLKPTPTN